MKLLICISKLILLYRSDTLLKNNTQPFFSINNNIIKNKKNNDRFYFKNFSYENKPNAKKINSKKKDKEQQ